jgi:hypothetical protein
MNKNAALRGSHKAEGFATKHKIHEKIVYILDAHERKLKPLPIVGVDDKQVMQRQYPLPGTGTVLIQEIGSAGRGIIVNQSFATESDIMVFQYHERVGVQRFRIGNWLYTLQAEFERLVFLKYSAHEVAVYEDCFAPLGDAGGDAWTDDPFATFEKYVYREVK